MKVLPTRKQAVWWLLGAVSLNLAHSGASARANVLTDIGRSISSLWSQKARKRDAAQTAFSKARAQSGQAEFLHDRLERTQKLLAASNASYLNYFRQMRATEAHLNQMRARQAELETRYQAHRELFGRRLAAMQRHGQTNYLQVTLGSQSFADFTRRTAFFQALTQRDAQLQSQIKADKAELAQAHNELMAQWQARNALQKQANHERERIAAGEAQQNAMWRQMNASRQELLRYAAAQQQSSQEITGMIGSLEARKSQIIADYEAQAARERAALRAQAVYAARVRQNQLRYTRRQNFYRQNSYRQNSYRVAKNNRSSSGSSYATRYSSRSSRMRSIPRYQIPRYQIQPRPQFAPRIDLAPRYAPRVELAPMSVDSLRSGAGNSGWTLPARGRLSSNFGMRYHPILRREKMHTGDDIAARYGSPIRAARGGRVLWAGWKKAYGNTVIVDVGGGLTTLYGHASKLGVRAGQPIRAGEYLGNVGSTGFSTGPHLHFEVRKSGKPIDPTRYLRGDKKG